MLYSALDVGKKVPYSVKRRLFLALENSRSESDKKVLESKKVRKFMEEHGTKGSLEGRLVTGIISLAGFAIGLFFLSSNITGNAVLSGGSLNSIK